MDSDQSKLSAFLLVLLIFLPSIGCRTGLDFREKAGQKYNTSEITNVLSRLSDQTIEQNESTETSNLQNPDSDISLASFEFSGSANESLSLSDALSLAIKNNEFIRDHSQFLSPTNPLLSDPQLINSIFDLDLQQASQQGVEAALANFDARLATGFQWGRNSVLQANSNLLSSDLLINDNSNWYGRLDKPFASGGTFSLIHNLNYANDRESFPLDPRYTGLLRGEIRHPLLAGRGRAVTAINGPNSYRTGQLNNGVTIAQIAEETAYIDFQMALARLMKQTEELYWDCWLATQIHQHQKTAFDNSEALLAQIQQRGVNGLSGGSASDVAQAEETYYFRKNRSDSSAHDLQQAILRLKNAIGFVDDAPSFTELVDQPVNSPFVFDLDSSMHNALNQRLELAKQDLQIQAIENQKLVASQLQRPQFDVVSGFQLNGLGDDLFDAETGALANLIDTDDVGWNIGFEFSMPVGLRNQRLNHRYFELLLAKASAARQVQANEIRQEIKFSANEVLKWNNTVELAQQRLQAAVRRLQAVHSDFVAGRSTLDHLLRSQDTVTESEIEISRAVTELTKAHINLLFRQGVTNFSNGTGSTGI